MNIPQIMSPGVRSESRICRFPIQFFVQILQKTADIWIFNAFFTGECTEKWAERCVHDFPSGLLESIELL